MRARGRSLVKTYVVGVERKREKERGRSPAPLESACNAMEGMGSGEGK